MFQILYFISFPVIYTFLWFPLKRRAYDRFSGRHPRRSTVTLNQVIVFNECRKSRKQVENLYLPMIVKNTGTRRKYL